jgi:bifunctional UDP-N-acetylglucosamine pyrophosphorylase/glucosamine-1-phosphate N-acetyltransferase
VTSWANRRQHPSTVPAVILAAGKGTRMRADQPKAVVRVGGRPMAARVADAMQGAGIRRIIAVVGHRAPDVRAALGAEVEYVVQEEQLGTGHAARCARLALEEYSGTVIVAYADIPLLTSDDIARLLEHHLLSGAASTMLTAVLSDPGTLGRIVRSPDRGVLGIVEARDASPDQLKINEINVGVYCFEAPQIFDLLSELSRDNAQAQYYLTDAIGKLVKSGLLVDAVALEVPHNGLGVNTPEDLARAQDLSASGGPR